MLEHNRRLNTEWLTKARTPKRCTELPCDRQIEKGELYSKFFQNGENNMCIVCVTRRQLDQLRYDVTDLEKWLEENG